MDGVALRTMIVINQISIGMSICALLAMVVGWSQVRNGKPGSEERLLLLFLYLLASIASVFASALSIAIARFWIYPVTLGLAIFVLAYLNVKIKQLWDD